MKIKSPRILTYSKDKKQKEKPMIHRRDAKYARRGAENEETNSLFLSLRSQRLRR